MKIYDWRFWLAYLGNVLLVAANALTFRFAELVNHLGGTEHLAGSIVSVGIFGGISVRLILGQAIDRYGPRRLWLLGSVSFVTGCLSFVGIDELTWSIYTARVLFAVGLATMFTCSIVHVQNRVPAAFRTEVIGNLGSSGFVGMILGSQLGDGIFTGLADGQGTQYRVLFGTAAGLGLLHLLAVLVLTRGDRHARPSATPAAHRLALQFWPGNVVLVALMMGVSFTVTTVFLTRYATSQSLQGIGTFFSTYAVAAFSFRLLTSRWSRTLGRHTMIRRGLLGHALGHWLIPWVTQEWQFVVPAVACGFGHALLFPAVVSKGTGSFPPHYRGTATTIVLGFVDLGAALSAPALGAIIDVFGFPTMFAVSGGTALTITAIYQWTSARKPDIDYEVPLESPAHAASHPSVYDVSARALGSRAPEPAEIALEAANRS